MFDKRYYLLYRGYYNKRARMHEGDAEDRLCYYLYSTSKIVGAVFIALGALSMTAATPKEGELCREKKKEE